MWACSVVRLTILACQNAFQHDFWNLFDFVCCVGTIYLVVVLYASLQGILRSVWCCFTSWLSSRSWTSTLWTGSVNFPFSALLVLQMKRLYFLMSVWFYLVSCFCSFCIMVVFGGRANEMHLQRVLCGARVVVCWHARRNGRRLQSWIIRRRSVLARQTVPIRNDVSSRVAKSRIHWHIDGVALS